MMRYPSESAILVEQGVLDRAASALAPIPAHDSLVVVTDDIVAGLYGQRCLDDIRAVVPSSFLYVIPNGESSKSLSEAERLYEVLAARAVGRDGLLVAVGGGVVSDLTGFVAATWKRGIDFAVFPTTLESAVDACIGGKTGVNLEAGKNLVGAFHWPRVVAIDPGALVTLPARDFRAGLAESIKHALIRDADFLAWHETQAGAILGLDMPTVTELIRRNLAIKSAYVKTDPFERTGERMLLNFGHTFGHAVERAAGYALRHGECVAIGMAAACRLSLRLGLLDAPGVQRVEDLICRFDLPLSIPSSARTTLTALADPVSRILSFMQNDKKAAGGVLRFVLLEDVGRPIIRDDVPAALLADVCRTIV